MGNCSLLNRNGISVGMMGIVGMNIVSWHIVTSITWAIGFLTASLVPLHRHGGFRTRRHTIGVLTFRSSGTPRASNAFCGIVDHLKLIRNCVF